MSGNAGDRIIMPRRANVNQNDEGGSAKDPDKVRAGSQGGLKGGPSRARKLSAQRKHDIAKEAALRRWSGNRSQRVQEAKASKRKKKD